MSLELKTMEVLEDFHRAPRAWLEKQAQELKLHYLLAHADDGVIWGRFDDRFKLKLAGEEIEAVKVELRSESLQQARLFDTTGELLLWKTDLGFQARYAGDGEGAPADFEDENLILWGTGTDEEPHEGFTLLIEGAQGMLHAPPAAKGRGKRLALVVRHYLGYDDESLLDEEPKDSIQKEGRMYVIISRLVGFEQVPGEKDDTATS
jgi:CRISPR-associated protein (TIGR03984 family)